MNITTNSTIYVTSSSGMGVGSNPAAWFVVVAFFLILARYWLDLRKETPMKTTRTQVKPCLKSALTAFAETSWAIMTNIAAWIVTLPIHAKALLE